MRDEQPLIKLSYRNPQTSKKMEAIVPYGRLKEDEASEVIEFPNNNIVLIERTAGRLSISCQMLTSSNDEEIDAEAVAAEIDVTILEVLPIEALHVFTNGTCTMNVPFNLTGDIYLRTKSLNTTHELKSTASITIVTPLEDQNSITIARPLIASILRVRTPLLNIRENVSAYCVKFYDCQLNIFEKGVLTTKGTNNTESDLHIKGMRHCGKLDLVNTQIKSESSVDFIDGSKTKLIDCQLFLEEFRVERLAKIEGERGYLQTTKSLNIKGIMKINRLTIVTPDGEIEGHVWGEEQLQVESTNSLQIFGNVGSNKTYTRTNLLYVAPGKEVQRPPVGSADYYTPGCLIGDKSLEINSVATAVLGGACLIGSNVTNKTGLSINYFGVIIAFDYRCPSLAQVPLGLDLPYKPEKYSDLLNPDKLLNLSLRVASNYFIRFRPLLSVMSFLRPFAEGAFNGTRTTLTAIYHDITANENQTESELALLVSDANNRLRSTASGVYSRLSIPDINTVRTFVSETSMQDVVNAVLAAKGYYILGNSIYHIGTNARAFANETTTILTQFPREILAKVRDAEFSSNISSSPVTRTSIQTLGLRTRRRPFGTLFKMHDFNPNIFSHPNHYTPSNPSVRDINITGQFGNPSAPTPTIPNISPPPVHNPSQLDQGQLQHLKDLANPPAPTPQQPLQQVPVPDSGKTVFTAPPTTVTTTPFPTPVVSNSDPIVIPFPQSGGIDLSGIKLPNGSGITPPDLSTKSVPDSGLINGSIDHATRLQNSSSQPPPVGTSNPDVPTVLATTSEVDLSHQADTDRISDSVGAPKVGNSTGQVHQDRQRGMTYISSSSVKDISRPPRLRSQVRFASSKPLDSRLHRMTTTDDWYTLTGEFMSGVAAGMAVNGAIFKAANIKYVGTFVRGVGLLGAGVMVAEAFGVAAEFERDNFMFTEEYEHIICNPLISEERKTRLLDESLLRQSNARKEAEQAKGLAANFKENPMIFGFGVGSLLSIEQLSGSTCAANAFMNLRIRNPFKSVTNDRHLEYLSKVVKAPVGIEHIEVAAGGAHGFENFANARTMASIRSNLGQDAIPYLSEVGPHRGKVYVGMSNPDATRVWRLDWDGNSDKGAHINWFYKFGEGKKDFYHGTINIDGMSRDMYLDIINHFPRKTNRIG